MEQKLDTWFFSPTGNRLVGEIFNDKRGRFPDGTQVVTSVIKNYKDGVVYTVSGSEYELGNPNFALFNIEEN